MKKKRYEVLYVGPGMLDGYWDNKTEQYLDDDMIIDLLNQEDYDSIWEKKCLKLTKRIEELSDTIMQMKIKQRNYLEALNRLEEDLN